MTRSSVMLLPILFVCALLLLLGGVIGLQLYRQYHDEIATGQATARSLAIMMDEHASRSFSAVDIFLLNHTETLSGMAGTLPVSTISALRERMNARLAELPQVRAFLVLDETGTSILDSASIQPRPFNAADRAYFRIHRERPHAGLFIGEPMQNRLTALWTLNVSRRINKPDGSFGGIIVAAVDPDYFTSFYREAAITPDNSLTLHHAGGFRIARIPEVGPGTGSSARDVPLFSGNYDNVDAGIYLSTGKPDGIRRHLAFRRVAGFPLIVAAGVSLDDTLATWRDNLAFSIAAMLLALLAGGGFLFILHRQIQRASSAEQRLRDAVDSMPDSFVLFDANDNLALFNRNTLDMLPGFQAFIGREGASYREVLEATAADFGTASTPEARQRHLAFRTARLAGEKRGFQYEWRMADGRWLRFSISPTSEGGSVGITSDITALKLAEQRLRDAIEALASGFVLYGSDGHLMVANHRFYELTGHDPEKIRAGTHYEELLEIVTQRRVARWPNFDVAAYKEQQRKDLWHPSGKPMDSEVRPGYWLRTQRHRTIDGGVISVIDDISDLKQAEQHLRDAIESLSDGFVLYGPDGRMRLANRHFYDLTGHDPAIVKPGTTFEEVTREVLRLRRQHWPDSDHGGFAAALERDYRNPSGKPIDGEALPGLWLRGVRHRTADGSTISVLSDITDLKLAEQRLRDAISALTEGFILYDRDGHMVMANQRYYEMTRQDPALVRPGVHFKDIMRITATREKDFTPGFELEDYVENLSREFTTPTGLPVDAEPFPGVWLRMQRCRTLDGGIITVFNDISDLKHAENRLRHAIEALAEGFVLFGRDGRIITINRRYYELTGHDPARIGPGTHNDEILASILAIGQREGRNDEALAYVASLKADFDNPSGQPFDIEAAPGYWLRTVRHRTPEGTIISIISNISDLKHAEQRLRDAIESLAEGFALYDRSGRLAMANSRFYDLTGHDPQRAAIGIHYDEMMQLVAGQQDRMADGVDVMDYVARLEADFYNPSGRPIDVQLKHGRWLRNQRRRTAEGGVIAIIDDITDLKRAEQRLRDAIEAINEAFIFYDADDRVVMFNRRFTEYFPALKDFVRPGVSFEEMIRHGINSGAFAINEKDREAWIIQRLEQHRNPAGHSIERQTEEGRWLLVHEQHTVDGGTVGIGTDITAIKRAERQMFDAIESISDGFVLYDKDERLILCNSKYREFYHEVEDLLVPGARFSDILRASIQRQMVDIEPGFLEEWLAERVEQFRKDSGSTETRLANGRWLRNTERRTSDGGVVGIRTDITALKEQQETLQRNITDLEAANRQVEQQSFRLRELADRFSEEKERAEEASRAKSEFLAMMSHEIRTPMNGVLGTIGLLQNTELSQQQNKLVITARESAEHLLTLINDILDFSKLEAGRIDLESIDFDLPRLIESAISMMNPRAVMKGLRLSSHLTPHVPHFAKGDPARLRQILFNLTGNAIKFTDSGEVEIIVDSAQQPDGHHDLTVKVRDTGIGIAADKTQHLFGRFSQADSSIARRFGGTGLGLAISKQLVELMGGKIGVDSTEGQGSVFWFTLPLQEGKPVETEIPAAQGDGPATQKSLRILVAEDNQVNQMVIGMMLRQLGHQVDLVTNGIEACEQVQKAPYDLVLMDMQMPEMDGLTATQTIRRLPQDCARLPIIALTANAMEGDRERYISGGMDDYVAKPIALPQLIAAINRVLGAGPAASGAGAAPQQQEAGEPLSEKAKSGLSNLLASLKKLN
ncbi:PAS-domain containing protein [Ferrovibrio sp.]|uniref:PAS-domain containing protein n=1 Tax=Ferrovibrio sp. TaxID=1917215 RepID=UPI0026077B46|nr:PAS-domain containing protein [Ferrovibrio sp.]